MEVTLSVLNVLHRVLINGPETLPTGTGKRFVDYPGCHCAVVDMPSPGDSASEAWLATIASEFACKSQAGKKGG